MKVTNKLIEEHEQKILDAREHVKSLKDLMKQVQSEIGENRRSDYLGTLAVNLRVLSLRAQEMFKLVSKVREDAEEKTQT